MKIRESRRIWTHLWLFVGTSIIGSVVFWINTSPDFLFRLSLSTAYTGLVLIAATMMISPIRLIRGLKNKLSIDIRRDVGIWAFIWTMLHVIFGFQRHFNGDILRYFLSPGPESWWSRILINGFGLANQFGLVGTIIILLLLITSNDLTIRWFGGSVGIPGRGSRSLTML